MYTKTDICNKAQQKLLQRETINDIDHPHSMAEKAYSSDWDMARQLAIKLMCPAFACRENHKITPDIYNKFYKPSDSLRVIYVNGKREFRLGFKNELIPLDGAMWGTSIEIMDIVDIEDTSLYSIDFADLLSLLLAYRNGGLITKDTNIVATVEKLYKMTEQSYGAVNSQERNFRKKGNEIKKSMMAWLGQ